MAKATAVPTVPTAIMAFEFATIQCQTRATIVATVVTPIKTRMTFQATQCLESHHSLSSGSRIVATACLTILTITDAKALGRSH